MTSPTPDPARPSIPVAVTQRFDLWLVCRAVIGLPLMAFGGWIVFKDVAPDGHVELTTAIVGMVFVAAGGGVLNFKALAAFGDFAKNVIPTIRGR
jgi:hypothetical protein